MILLQILQGTDFTPKHGDYRHQGYNPQGVFLVAKIAAMTNKVAYTRFYWVSPWRHCNARPPLA